MKRASRRPVMGRRLKNMQVLKYLWYKTFLPTNTFFLQMVQYSLQAAYLLLDGYGKNHKRPSRLQAALYTKAGINV